MTRRTFTASMAAAAGAAPPKSQLGIATTCYLSFWRPRDMQEFLEHAIALGAGGVQSPLPADIPTHRARREQAGLFYEAMVPLGADIQPLIRKAKEAGAVAARVAALGGRRYETFASMAEWKAFVAEAREKIAVAARAAEAEKFPLALENHKDWTLEEMLALMREFGGEYFGVLLDTGNNIALLDDPYEVVERLAPYALATHLKDMGWQEHPEGFELAEMVFGEGLLDMARIVATIRRARPQTKMTLEMITRNPLVVPCFGAKYWATMADRPAADLARQLRMMRARKLSQALPRLDALPAEQQRLLEDENVKRCLHVARERYGL